MVSVTPADPAGDGPGVRALPDALFDPASVAVAGASDNPEEVGLLAGEGRPPELRHASLLTGWRGAPPVDLDAAAEHPELAELEVDPLLVHPVGALALDAHGVPGAG
jgi:hypothetical protein